jgi:hypothetical protein
LFIHFNLYTIRKLKSSALYLTVFLPRLKGYKIESMNGARQASYNKGMNEDERRTIRTELRDAWGQKEHL